jgi:hypothetical protein
MGRPQDYHPRQNPPAGKGTVLLRLSTREPIGRQRSQPIRLSECEGANVATHDGALAGQFDCGEYRPSLIVHPEPLCLATDRAQNTKRPIRMLIRC